MLDDSLTGGHLEQATQPDSPADTVADQDEEEAATRGTDRTEHKNLTVGDRFAGFQVRRTLGRGAMGVVYEAWIRRSSVPLRSSCCARRVGARPSDCCEKPELSRASIIRASCGSGGPMCTAGAVFIAMELVEGQNLREWMKTPRPWTEVLPVMIGAGRGLAAAHAAGVIHRDFKPENVLVGADGQARVLDFGIARVSALHPDHFTYTSDGSMSRDGSRDRPPDGEASCAAEPLSGSFAGLPIDGAEQLTEVGSLIGTLLYMAPEQHEREAADERSDQFGFCTTLFEALYGKHPFPAKTVEQLAMRVCEGQISFPDDHAKVPRWLEKVIVQGLSPKREDRFPTMEALIDALERHPTRRRRRNSVLTVSAVALVAVTLGVMIPRSEAADPCVDVGHEIDEVLGQAARERISARFAALNQPWAVEMGERVDGALTAWTGRWVEARTEVCQARHAHREETILDQRREACLAEQLARVGALGEVLTEAGNRTLTNAEHMLAALPDPAICIGEDPPVGRPQLDGQEQLVEELAELVWLMLAEDNETRERAERLVEQVRALPSSPESQSLLADALIVLAHTQIVDGDLALAEARLHEAVRTAERIEADGIRARATVDLGWTLANTPGRADDAIVVLEDAAALLERTGNPRFEYERQQQALGEALLASGEHKRARAVFEGLLAAIGDKASSYVPHATTLMGLSRVAAAEGDHKHALEYANAALAAFERKVGDSHPLLAAPLTNIGQAQAGLDNYEAARAALARSIAIRRAQLEGESTDGNRSRLAEVLMDLGNLDSMSGNPDAAADEYREALALVPESDYSNRALVLFNLGVDHQIAGRSEQALANYQEALRLGERVHPMDSPQVVGARLGVGSMLASLGRPAEARAPLERCLDDWPTSMVDTADEGELRFGLARTLEALEGWSPRVESLVADASAIYLRLEMRSAVAEIDAWMASKRPKAPKP